MEIQTLWSIGMALLVVSIFVTVKEVRTGDGSKVLSTLLKLTASIVIIIAMLRDEPKWYDYCLMLIFVVGAIVDIVYLVRYLSKKG